MKRKRLSDAVDALREQVMADAGAVFAEGCAAATEAGYASIVAGMLTETGLTQHSSRILPVSTAGVSVTGKVTQNSKGAAQPILGLRPAEIGPDGKPIQRSFVQARISHGIQSDPRNVRVAVSMNVAKLSKALASGKFKLFEIKVGASRMASDEPHVAAYIAEHGLEDVDITQLHAAKHLNKASRVVPAEFSVRLQKSKFSKGRVKGTVG